MRRISRVCMSTAYFAMLIAGCRLAAQNLVINHLSLNPRVIIYELPDPDGREEAIRYIANLHDRFWSGAELIDAGQTSESVLRRKFQQTCVLYTTLGTKSKLVRLATAGMGWEIRDGVFHWREVDVPLDEVRLFSRARTPTPPDISPFTRLARTSVLKVSIRY